MRKVILAAKAPAQSLLVQHIASLDGECEVLSLADLRAIGITHTLRRLLGCANDTVYLLSGDLEQHGYKQTALLAALLTTSRNVVRLETDNSIRQVKKWRLFVNFASVILASLKNIFTASAAFVMLLWLSICSRKSEVNRQSGDILYVFPGFWSGFKAGGAIAHIAGIVNAFSRAGHNVIYPSSWIPDGLSSAVEHQHLKLLSDWGFPAEANIYRLQWKIFRSVKRRIGNRKISFVYSRLTLGSYASVLLSRSLKVPLVVEYNGSEAWIAQNWGNGLRFRRLAELSEQASLRHADLIVTVSKPLSDQLVARGLEPARVIYQPNGVDTSLFDPDRFTQSEIDQFRSDLGIPMDALVFGFIGTFGRWHGTDVLACSIAEIMQNHRHWVEEKKVRFLVAGDGDMRPCFIEKISLMDAQSLIHMPGYFPQEQGPLMMASCDVLMAPHIANADGTPFFGSPIKLFEYLASGRPIIASDLDQIGEVLSEKVSLMDRRHLGNNPDYQEELISPALLCAPGSSIDLINAILRAGNDPGWRESAGLAARKLAVEKHGWDKNVKQILDCLEPQAE